MAFPLEDQLSKQLSAGELRLFGLPEIERLTGIGCEALRKEIDAGRLGAFRINGRWRVTLNQLGAWLMRAEKPAADS